MAGNRNGRNRWGMIPLLLAAALCSGACQDERSVPAAEAVFRSPGFGIRRIRLLTYNVFGEIEPSAARMRALLETIARENADIIALQEAKPWIIRRILAEPWARHMFHPQVAWPTERHGDLFIFSRFPVVTTVLVRLPTVMGRNILAITIPVNGRRVKIGNIHLESFLMAYSMRADQLDTCFRILDIDCEDAVLLGDFNFGDDEALEKSRIPADWRDPWRILHPGRPGYTWDTRLSHWARRTSFDGEGSRRLDRILVRSEYWHPEETRLLGNEPYIPGNREYFPSDHFGLVTTLTCADAPGPPGIARTP